MRSKIIVFCFLFISINIFGQEKEFPSLSGPYVGQTPPGNTPVLFAPEIISTLDASIHSTLTFSPDNKEAYFARLMSPSGFPSYGEIFMMKEVNSEWQKPEIMKQAGDAFSPMLSPDGNQLFFATHDRLKKMVRVDSNWSASIDLGDTINFQKR